MARIDQNTVDRILDAARIEEVVRSYGVDLHKAGTILKGLCPFHEEKTPSFIVSPAKGIFKCFGCGKGGHAAKFVMEKEQCTYPDALRKLAQMYNIEVPEREMTPEEKRREMERQNLLEIMEWYAKFCADCMQNDPMGRGVGLSYFRQRSFSDESIRKFRLGYALDKNIVEEEARKAGFSKETMLKSGILGKNEGENREFDRFRSRVIFPIIGLSGKVVAFGGRALEKDARSKYVNSPELVGIYEKNRELYGFFQAKSDIQKRNNCILVEGYADVISMHQAGMTNTVAACGTAFTERQMESVRRFTNNLTVMDDGDGAGIAAAQKAADIALKAGMTVRMVLLPDGQDPDDFAKSHSAEQIEQYIETNGMNFVEFKKKVLSGGRENNPDVTNRVLDSVIETISILPDAITRELYVKETMKRFDMSKEAIEEKLRAKIGAAEELRNRQETNDRIRENERREAEKANEPVYKYAIQEREIIQFIVRHCGETVDIQNGETVERYMANDILIATLNNYVRHINGSEECELRMENPAYQKFIDCIAQEEITDDRFFTFNEDDDIRKIATSLMLDKEVTSKRFDTDLEFNVCEDDPQYERKRKDYEERLRQEREVKMRLDIETLAHEYARVVLTDLLNETRRLMTSQPDNMMELMVRLQKQMNLLQELNNPKYNE